MGTLLGRIRDLKKLSLDWFALGISSVEAIDFWQSKQANPRFYPSWGVEFKCGAEWPAKGYGKSASGRLRLKLADASLDFRKQVFLGHPKVILGLKI